MIEGRSAVTRLGAASRLSAMDMPTPSSVSHHVNPTPSQSPLRSRLCFSIAPAEVRVPLRDAAQKFVRLPSSLQRAIDHGERHHGVEQHGQEDT